MLTVTRPTWGTGRKFGVRLQEHRTEVEGWRPKRNGHSQEVNAHPAWQNTTNPLSPTMRLKRVINWSKAMVIDREPDCLTRLKRLSISAKKANMPWIGMSAATNSDTPTTTFLTQHPPVVSRTGRTEYLFLLMKASDKGRNVKYR